MLLKVHLSLFLSMSLSASLTYTPAHKHILSLPCMHSTYRSWVLGDLSEYPAVSLIHCLTSATALRPTYSKSAHLFWVPNLRGQHIIKVEGRPGTLPLTHANLVELKPRLPPQPCVH